MAEVYEFLSEHVFGFVPDSEFTNPYLVHDVALDAPGGAAMRRRNLLAYMAAFQDAPRVLVCGEAPGPWGARFSGLAFTSEAQLVERKLPFSGEATSRGGPYKERSAEVVWSAIMPRWSDAFLWNAVPFHPYNNNVGPLSIRNPTAAEVRGHAWILQGVVEAMQPDLVVALGRAAEHACAHIGVESVYVRHPSRGGSSACTAGLRQVLELDVIA